jgi:hypothetical protein
VTELESFKRWILELLNKAVSTTGLRINLKMFMRRRGDCHTQFSDKSQNFPEEHLENSELWTAGNAAGIGTVLSIYSVTAKLTYSMNLKRAPHC